jgi:plastocyanin
VTRRRAAAAPTLLALLALLALPVLTGCSGGSVVAPPAGPPATELRIGLLDYRFQLSAGTLATGGVTVVATNAGGTAHDAVLGQGGHAIGGSRVLAPGESQTFRVQVTAGSPVHVECTLPGHEAAGMHATVAVAGAAAGG